MSKIARNFEILAEFLLISGQEEEARSFLEKALEVLHVIYFRFMILLQVV